MRVFHLIAPLVALAVTACSGAPHDKLNVDQPFVRLSAVSGNPSAAYFALNGGPVADRLISISSPLAVRAELHDTKMEGGMMKMIPLADGIEVPAKGEIAFESGGKHVMLYDVSPKVAVGGKMPLVLTFASGAKLETQAEVIAAGADAPGHHNH
jgi:periplasmic copper chaperone A